MNSDVGNQIGVAKQGRLFSPVWVWISIPAAVLAIVGNVVGLFVPSIYSRLTPAFLPQALAQDVASLILISPAMLVLAALSLRGSIRAYLLWLGVIVFTVYNYVIYAFSVPFGSLFLLWVIVLGLCVYALIGAISSTSHEKIVKVFTKQRQVSVSAWVLIVVAALFGLLWLSEDVPALLAGSIPSSVAQMAVPTNPVHVLDFAFFLPAAILTGVMLLRHVPLGYTVLPGFLVFLVLTGVPILVTPLEQAAIGQEQAWGVTLPIGVLTAVLLGLLAWVMWSIDESR